MTTPTPDQTPSEPAAGDEAVRRVGRAVEAWRNRLLDLSRRNRALNFRPARVATVTVRDELPTEVFRLLYVEERRMRFAAMRPSAQPGADATTGAAAPEVAYRRPATGAIADRHRDDVLQCDHTPESLDKSLRRLAELARSSEEEQGVSTLFLALGMLTFSDPGSAEGTLRAPVVLLPVRLERAPGGAGFTVEAGEDEPIANPTLIEYLRVMHRVAVPDLPEASAETALDLGAYLDAVAAIAHARDWTLSNDIHLAAFAFAKLVMFKDLERNAGRFAEHRLVRQLALRDGTGQVGLPAEVQQMDLDEAFAVESTFQVVDADGSQLRAMATVALGHDAVIEGPPGTGKSQTITNLIANALSRGQSVLFVAEKMAALDVVHRRLGEAGLGDFCFVLHATKGNKAAVLADLRRTWEAAVARPTGAPTPSGRLGRTRAELTAYAREMHTPVAPLGATPFEAFGRFAEAADAPRIRFEGEAEGFDRSRLDALQDQAEAFRRAAEAVGDVAGSAWRESRLEHVSEPVLERIAAATREVQRLAADFVDAARETQESLGGPAAATIRDAATVRQFRELAGRAPGCSAEHLEDAGWQRTPADAIRLMDSGEHHRALEARITAQLRPAAFHEVAAEDVAYVRERRRGWRAWFAWVDGRYRRIRRAWRALACTPAPPSMAVLLEQAERVLQWRSARERLLADDAVGARLFGRHWRGLETDWRALRRFVEWVSDYRVFLERNASPDRARAVVLDGAPALGPADRLLAAADALPAALEAWCEAAGWPRAHFAGAAMADVHQRATALLAELPMAARWAVLQRALRALEPGPIAGGARAVMEGTLRAADLPPALQRAFHERWCDWIVRTRPLLASFDAGSHEQRVADFRRLDREMLVANRTALAARLRDAASHRLADGSLAPARAYLQRELARQRRFSPLRRTVTEAGPVIRALKPCFLMSPLAVAQFWPAEQPPFDLVVFDEASQLPTEDAVGAICRGRQLVVVGDPKQLPPTDFFSASLAGDDMPLHEDGSPVIEDTESVLEEFLGSGTPKARLTWHYRSAHESLIHFSNASFYDAELLTFPSVETAASRVGLSFRFVEDGLYEGGGVNRAEARAVVDAIVAHFRESPDRSLGVGTFSARQQQAIHDELELRRRADLSLEAFLDPRRHEPFFVKNLENIQGDERDVILLSVTYGRGPDGRVRYNFGPINGENGWRRLNVLVTRARERMVVFASMRSVDISPVAAASRGPTLLREFLHYAEHGVLEGHRVNALAETESPFERAVLRELGARGYLVDPQVGVAGYRIDLGVRVPEQPGRYVCGVECDGATYHAAPTARDRDRLRQQVLEDRGWSIVRIWSTDWFKDRDGQLARVLGFIENARANLREAEDAGNGAGDRTLRPPARETAAPPVVMAEPAPAAPAMQPPPVAVAAYRRASVAGRFAGRPLLEESVRAIASVVEEVVHSEGPVHHELLCARVVEAWGQRQGARIRGAIERAIDSAVRGARIDRRGAFYSAPGVAIEVRTGRDGDHGAEHVPPRELALAVCLVVSASRVTDATLMVALRDLLGVSTGAASRAAAAAALEALRSNGTIVHGPSGLTLRAWPDGG